MGRYNYPRIHSKLEGEKNPPGGLPSYKSYETGAGFSKKPRSWVAKRAYLETWDLSRKCEGCLKPADRQAKELSRLIIGNTLTLGTGAWLSFVCGRRSGKVCPSTTECFDLVRFMVSLIMKLSQFPYFLRKESKSLERSFVYIYFLRKIIHESY